MAHLRAIPSFLGLVIRIFFSKDGLAAMAKDSAPPAFEEDDRFKC